ncbi:MAG TPA: hypothetical protein VGI05_05105 [Streptosporangiaceae bacterium]|jgi:hypothetical protein
MSDSFVTSAALTTDAQSVTQIELAVQVDDFVSGETVEISGQATQSGGAFANYYDIQKVPDAVTGTDAKPHRSVTVTTHPIPPFPFVQGQPVTVVLRVSRVWVTVLGPQSGVSPDSSNTTWAPPTVVASIDGTVTPW